MEITTFEGIVEAGRVRIADNIVLPENTRVFIVVPTTKQAPTTQKFDLAAMIAMMPDNYQPHEEDWGAPVGKEEW